MMLTKTDFMLYQDAPMHLWVHKNQPLAVTEPSPYDQYLMAQGIRIEEVASAYLEDVLHKRYSNPELMLQKTLTDGFFETRADVVVYDGEAGVCDLYEIKSGTSISKMHLYDVAFTYLVSAVSLRVRDVFIVHLDKEFVKAGDLDLEKLFVVENVTSAVNELLEEVKSARESALWAVQQPNPEAILNCQKPKTCPCPELCHPDLPEYSIYDLTRLSRNKALDLVDNGVRSIFEVPENYPLTKRQRRQVKAVKMGIPLINQQAIRSALNTLRYPLYFLDYETCNPGIPIFDGYRPYQHMVFQYSLHILSDPDGEPSHFECLATGQDDPLLELLPHLASKIGETGSVVVWNQAFEASRNREMAERYPAYADLLMGVNARIQDLMQVFKTGDYLHPQFHGSYSIKAVLPVLVPDFEQAYADLPISKGDDAMLAWLVIVSGELTPTEIEANREALLRYCALDSLAMVAIWRVLRELVGL
jgi:hypothetical protein